MSVANGKISYRMGTKIGVNGDGDLQQVFGVSNKEHSWYFLTAPINMWAKFKPFRHPGGAIYSDHYRGAQGQAQTSARGTAGLNANYGLVAPSGSESNIPSDVINKLWSYERIRNGTDPQQAEDFEGYYHNAQPPVIPMRPDNLDPLSGSFITYYSAFQSDGIDFSPIQRGTRDDTIGLEDFGGLDGWYVCLLLCTNMNFSSSGSWKWKTASTPIQKNSSGGYAGMVACPALTHGEVTTLGNYKYYYICLADTKYDDWSQNPPVTMFKPIPAGQAIDIKGVITVSTQVVSRVSIKSAAFVSNPSASSFPSDANFAPYVGSGNTSYYNVNNNYYVALKLSVEAPLQTAITLNASDMRLALSTTFNGGAPRGLTVTMRNSSYTQVSSVTIAAGATATIYLICSAQALAYDASGRAALVTENGQQLKVFFTFSHNGVSFSSGQFIRLTNP